MVPELGGQFWGKDEGKLLQGRCHVLQCMWFPVAYQQVRIFPFTEERIQEKAVVKQKQVYLETYTLHGKNEDHLRKWEQPQGLRDWAFNRLGNFIH